MTKKIFNSDLETSGQVVASTLTDGTATLSGGVFTASTITDGTATLSGGVFTASTITDGTATLSGGVFTASTITDGTLSIAGGEIVGPTIIKSDNSTHNNVLSYLELDAPGSAAPDQHKLDLEVYNNFGQASVADANAILELKSRSRKGSADKTSIIQLDSGGISLQTDGAEGIELKSDITGNLSHNVVIRDDLVLYDPLVFRKEVTSAGDTEDLTAANPTIQAYLQSVDTNQEQCGLQIDIPVFRKVKFTGGGTVRINEDDDNTYLYLPNLAEDASVSNGIDSHYIGVDTDGKVYKHATVDFFTGTHVYPSEDLIPAGNAVYLESEVARLNNLANSPICVGIVISSHEVTTHKACSLFEFTDQNRPSHLVKIASVGDSRHKGCQGFNVCNENGDIQPGDLLVTSSTPGYLMKQDDDIMRSKTVGKAMEAVTFDDNGQATGVYGFVYCG